MSDINLNKIKNIFFVGIAGDGMSAIAQYLAGSGKTISGSDRQFKKDHKNSRQILLEKENISCFPQDCSGLHKNIDLVVISTAIEPTVPEYKKALELKINICMRSDLLAAICNSRKTIAVSGTSGKSTVAAMIYHILEKNGKDPSLITGAGLIELQQKGKIGNAVFGKGEYLIIEADESDGSLVKYKPDIGIILNIDKDHKELDELLNLFRTFADQSKYLIVNQQYERSKVLSVNKQNDFGFFSCGFIISDFQKGNFSIDFKINNSQFHLDHPGIHTAENAAAAVAATSATGVDPDNAASALTNYAGIYRRHQIVARKNGITLIDDYAHNPAKLAASIQACQNENGRLYVWFQPHGFGPTRFLKNEFIEEISAVLREDDELYMSEIFYAGGTVSKDISSEDLINGIAKNGLNAYYVEKRQDFPDRIKNILKKEDIILLTGARDPSLSDFAQYVSKILFSS